jgi:hypothetical protein
MSKSETIHLSSNIESFIMTLRNRKIILDFDLAKIYGTNTKRLNEQVKRNKARFPGDFMFQLNKQEKDQVVANCDHLVKLKFASTLPYAFTEFGSIMAANVLNSTQAVDVSVFVVRAFIKLRELALENKEIISKIDHLEQKYDSKFKIVFDAIRELMEPKTPPRRRIGF